MASGFRFNPPSVELDAELAWVLERAFGPLEAPASGRSVLDAVRAVGLAGIFDLAARIGARTPSERLRDELGEDGAEELVRAHLQVAARSLIVERLSREVASVARRHDAPLMFLKGAALMLAGWLQPGSRSMSDVDVLACSRDAPRLQRHLRDAGWQEMPGPSGEHQLEMLVHHSGVGLEIHTVVLGVRTVVGDSISLAGLLEDGLCDPLPDPLTGSLRPHDEVLLAHILVHGIAQHGLKPRSYPMMRLIADAQDLCSEGERWEELLPRAMPWIVGDVSIEEAEAVRDLAVRLDGGEKPADIVAAGDFAGRLLGHILAGVLDDRYRNSLRLRSLTNPLAARSRARTLARDAFHTVWLTRAQVELLYGRPRTPFGYWGWRLWRPFDLALRSARYGSAWLVARFRR